MKIYCFVKQFLCNFWKKILFSVDKSLHQNNKNDKAAAITVKLENEKMQSDSPNCSSNTKVILPPKSNLKLANKNSEKIKTSHITQFFSPKPSSKLNSTQDSEDSQNQYQFQKLN